MYTRFEALELSLVALGSLRPVVKKIVACDPPEADQIRRSASSTARNLAEGRRRSGKDRRHHFRMASGSAPGASGGCPRRLRGWLFIWVAVAESSKPQFDHRANGASSLGPSHPNRAF